MADKIKVKEQRKDALTDVSAGFVVSDERVHWQLDTQLLNKPRHADGIVETDPPLKPSRVDGVRKPKIAFSKKAKVFVQAQWAAEVAGGTAFVLVPVFFGGGALAYWALPAEPALHNIPLGLAVVTLLLVIARRLELAASVCAVIAVFLITLSGMAAAQWRTHMVGTSMLGGAVTTTVTGRVVRVEVRPDTSMRLTLDIISTEKPTLSYAPDRVRATLRQSLDGARAGAVVQGRVSLRNASGPFRPGGFDFSFHAYFQRIGAYGFFLGAPKIIEGASPTRAALMNAHIANARQWLGARVRAVADGTPQGAVSAALITGEKTPIPEADAETLRLSGLAHILSISGLHMALVAGTVMGALRAMAAVAPAFAARWPIKKYAAATALVTIACYLFIAGASVATQRSFLMLGIMLGAVLLDRAAVTIRNLALAALLVLIIAPETIAGPSFQMSFAATASLIALYSGWSAQRLQRDPQSSGWEPRNLLRQSGGYVAGLSMTSLVAGAATGLYAVYHFHRIATLGLLANLLAVPIVSIVTMPLAILGVIMIPFGLDGFVFSAMIASVEAVMAIAGNVVALSPGAIVGEIPLSSLLLGTLSLICLTLLRSHLRWIGVGFAGVAFMLAQHNEMPVVLISEDARQMALLRIDGDQRLLAVNRARPNTFTMDQWRPAYRIDDILKPNKSNGDSAEARQSAMTCNDRACWAGVGQEGQSLAYLNKRPLRTDNAAWQALCGKHAVIIHAYVPSRQHCTDGTLEVVAQQLARSGAAALYINHETGALTLRHALNDSFRPWQTQRQFSRAARNLSPYYSPPKKTDVAS